MRLPSFFITLAFSLLGTLWAGAVAPSFYQPVVGATVLHGNSFKFQAVMNGTAPFTFTWKHGTQVVTTGTSVFYGLSGGIGMLTVTGSTSTAGTYTVTVSNSDGTVTSSPVTLVVNPNPPVIYKQPGPVDMLADPSVTTTLTVGATGLTPLVVQWQKNGRGYGSAVTSYSSDQSISFPSGAANSGDYRCLISNADGSATSITIPVHFWTTTGVVQDTKHKVALPGSSVAFSTKIYTTASNWTYQWQHNGQNIYGASSSSLSLTAGSLADAGDYRVVVKTDTGTYYSDVANLSVVGVPAPGAGSPGKTAVLTLPVAGKSLAYAWYTTNGAVATSSKHYSGQATSRLSILAAAQADAGLTYRCKVWRTDDPTDQVTSNSTTLSLETLPPAFDPVVLNDAVVAQDYTAQLSANGSITRYAASGLPPGLVCDAASGLISGAPRAAGVFHVKVYATNPVGTTAAGPFTMNVTAFPADMTANLSGPVWIDGSTEMFAAMSMSVTKAGIFSGKLSFTFDQGSLHSLPFSGTVSGTVDGVLGFSTPILLSSSWQGSFSGPHVVIVVWSSLGGWAITLAPAGGPVFATMFPHQNGWDAHTNPATSYAGYYTMEIKENASTGDLPPEAGGSGWGTFIVKTDGTLTFNGRLQDGTAFAAPAFMDSTGGVWVHAWLYGYKGQFEGSLNIAAGDPDNHGWDNAVSGSFTSVRPPSTIVLPDFASITNAYFNGLQMQYTATGCKYLPPSTKKDLVSSDYMLSTADYVYDPVTGGTPNINLYFDLEGQDSTFSAPGYLRKTNTAFFLPYVSGGLVKFGSLTFAPATGLFTGTFTQYTLDEFGTVLSAWPLTYQGVVTRADARYSTGYGAGYYIRTYTDVQTDPANARNVSRVNLITTRRVSIWPP